MSFDESSFAETARFVAAPHAVWRELEGRAFVLDGNTGEHYETNAVGGAIFRLAAEGRDVSAIRAELLAVFDVDAARLDGDLRAYLSELVRRGLLVARGA